MCPNCNAEDHKILGDPRVSPKVSKFLRFDYKVVKCDRCKLYYVNPTIDFTTEEWQSIYDTGYFYKRSKWYIKKRLKDNRVRLGKMNQLSANRISKFLDIGCGEGYTLIEALSRGWITYGLDIVDHRVSQAKNSKIKFITSELLNSNFEDNFFDAIYLDSVLEHLIDPTSYLMEINRILKNGGILYIGVPNEDSLFNLLRKFYFFVTKKKITEKITPFKEPYHVIGFNQESFKDLLLRNEFQIHEIRNFACRVEFLKIQPFTVEYFKTMLLLPIYLLAVPLKKEVYLEAYVSKSLSN